MSLTLARLGVVAGSFPIAVGGDVESIATVTVGSGGASSIEFTSIPGTYQHLQVRGIARSTYTSSSLVRGLLRVNSDTGSSYAWHALYGSGSSAAASAGSTQSSVRLSDAVPWNSASAGLMGAFVIDFLDYASTSKTKTLRVLAGVDLNGSGEIDVSSGLWNSTSAITSLSLYLGAGNFTQYSQAALYGVKAP